MLKWCVLDSKGSRKNNFPFLGVAAPVCQGAKTAHTLRMERMSNAARPDGSAHKHGKLFFREPSDTEAHANQPQVLWENSGNHALYYKTRDLTPTPILVGERE